MLTLNGNIEEVDFQLDIPSASITGLAELKTGARIEVMRVGETTYSRYEVVQVGKSQDGVGVSATVKADRRN
jgi:hypothetical protein